MKVHQTGLCLIVVVIVTAGMTLNAWGQFREVPPRFEEFHLVNLLGFPSIREHLVDEFELSEELLPSLKELGSVRLKNMHRRRDLRTKSRKMSNEQFDAARTKLLETIQQANLENWAKAENLLTEAQVARLQQLSIQRLGVSALADPEVIKVLGLDQDQIKLALKLREQFDQKKIALWDQQRHDFRQKRLTPNSKEMIEHNIANKKKRDEAEVEYSNEVYDAVLDEKQKQTFSDIRGDTFVFRFDFDFAKTKVQWHTDPLDRTSE